MKSSMKEIYVIQDVKTKEYFWQYRIEEGFSANGLDMARCLRRNLR